MIRILHPSIDDWQKTVIIRGVLDNDSLSNLKTDFYQRELLPSTSRKNIRAAIEAGEKLPDVVLGMRGDDFDVENDILILKDPTFIIDGQQRIKTILELFATAKFSPRLGSVIHLNTSPEFERALFHKLNQFQIKVSPNIILRNTKETHPLITTLYGLSNSDRQFALFDRVCWSQNMRRQEIISATALLKVILNLHRHIAPGLGQEGGITRLVPLSDRLVSRIGLPMARANIKLLFETIDSIWGIRRIQIKGGAPYMRRSFLDVFTKLLSDHRDFWKNEKEDRLDISYLLKKKLASFPFEDPEINRLCAATGAARLTLYIHLLNHINSGKRINRLTPRKPAITFELEEDSSDELDEIAI